MAQNAFQSGGGFGFNVLASEQANTNDGVDQRPEGNPPPVVVPPPLRLGNTGDMGVNGPEGPRGPQGPAGNQGPQGNPGVQGQPGTQGLTGGTGPIGAQGPTGNQGPDGNQGPLGNQGPAGDKGLAGDQGPQGIQGPAGDKGLTGDQGVQGPTGDKGLTGDQGPAGVQGPTGDKGLTGDQGPAGVQGPLGLPGPDGNPGPDGLPGSNGARTLLVVVVDSNLGNTTFSGQTNTFNATPILTSTDAVWDSYDNGIRFINAGLYKITTTCKIECYGPSVWQDNVQVTMGVMLSPDTYVVPPGFNQSSKVRVTSNGNYDYNNYEQWTDEFIVEWDGLAWPDYISLRIYTNLGPGGNTSQLAKVSAVVAVTRIGDFPVPPPPI
jgi:hypothetical protein